MFGRKRLNNIPTPEQRYLRSDARSTAYRAASDRRTADEQRAKLLRTRYAPDAAQRQRLSMIVKTGTLTRNSQGVWRVDGWTVKRHGPSLALPSGRIRGGINIPAFGNLTIHDLCYAAHGAHCGCTRR